MRDSPPNEDRILIWVFKGINIILGKFKPLGCTTCDWSLKEMNYLLCRVVSPLGFDPTIPSTWNETGVSFVISSDSVWDNCYLNRSDFWSFWCAMDSGCVTLAPQCIHLLRKTRKKYIKAGWRFFLKGTLAVLKDMVAHACMRSKERRIAKTSRPIWVLEPSPRQSRAI